MRTETLGKATYVIMVGNRPYAGLHPAEDCGTMLMADNTDAGYTAIRYLESRDMLEGELTTPLPHYMRCGNSKRFKKLLMSVGIQRNDAEHMAAMAARLSKISVSKRSKLDYQRLWQYVLFACMRIVERPDDI